MPVPSQSLTPSTDLLPEGGTLATVVLTPDVMTEAGISETDTGSLSTSNTYKFRNNGRTFLHFKKTGANACTVAIASQAALRGHTVAGESVTVPATTGDVFIGPFAADVYDDLSHDVSFTVSEVTGLTVAVVSL